MHATTGRRFRRMAFVASGLSTLAFSAASAQQNGIVGYGAPTAYQPGQAFLASPQGFGFQPTQDVFVTALGYFMPTSMPYNPNTVGTVEYLYQNDGTGHLTMLASTGSGTNSYRSVPVAGAEWGVVGAFRYADLTGPLLLAAGNSYVITHFGPMQVNISAPGTVLASDFVLDGGYTVTPNGTSSPMVERYAAPEQTGAVFEYDVVATPEPSILALLATGFAGIFGMGARRRHARKDLYH